jgi:hypothetical protein
MDRAGAGRLFAVAIIAALALAAGGLLAQSAATRAARPTTGQAPPPRADGNGDLVVVSRPAGPPRIATGRVDPLGREITVSCGSCHANLPPSSETNSGSQLIEFHQGLDFQHGTLQCGSCHQPPNYNSLRLAGGRELDFADVQRLCAQCHAAQARDYERGAHGGMNGYWDLSRGPRRRHGCTDCHDPHAPAFPYMVPTFQPFDRFLSPAAGEERHD